MVAPGGEIQIQTACVEILSVTIETTSAHLIFKAHYPMTVIELRQANVALALVCGVVDGHEPAIGSRAGPQPRGRVSYVASDLVIGHDEFSRIEKSSTIVTSTSTASGPAHRFAPGNTRQVRKFPGVSQNLARRPKAA